MRPSTFFDPTAASHASEFTFDGAEAQHAVTVQRHGVGDTIDIVDGHGVRLRCVIAEIRGRDAVRLHVTERIEEPRPALWITVVQPLIKDAELAIDLLTQAGVQQIVPWHAQRSVVQWRADRVEKAQAKWSNAAHVAAKQSRRAWWPIISPLADTDTVVELLRAADHGLILDAEAEVPIGSVEPMGQGSSVIVVGPEGGLTAAEVEAFRSWPSVRIGHAVLRSAVAGAAAVFTLLGHSGSS